MESFTEHELIDLEMEFKSFLSQANQEQNFREIIESTNNYISFDEAWSTIRGRYPYLCQFIGGLASVFPGTSTVESDFSVICFEKDDYHTSLTNFSLEGILQCKQLKLLNIQALI